MKRFLAIIASVAALAACAKIEPDKGSENNPEEKKGTAPVISNLSSTNLIVYPAECGRTETVTFLVKDATGGVTASCGTGLTANITVGEEGAGTLTVLATESLPEKSSVTITASNDYGKETAVIEVVKANLSIDRESYDAAVAGASLVVGVSSNVGCRAKVSDEASSWLHIEQGSMGYAVTIDRSTIYEPRTGTITFMDRNAILKKTFTVNQEAAPDYIKLERAALVALYNSTDGPNWQRLSSELGGITLSVDKWCTDAPISEWYGVDVNSSGHVVYLHLTDLGLKGTLPEELGDLIYCQDLWLGGNDLSGELPKRIGEMKSLKDLSAFGMSLSGDLSESSLSQIAPHLKSISLSGNLFTGTFPEWVSQMPSSANFWLQGNCLSGKVPSAVVAHPRWSEVVYDGTGRTVGQVNMEQREGYILTE